MRNTWRKARPSSAPYHKAEDPRTGFIYRVLAVYSDPRKAFSRAFCLVHSPMTGSLGDMGDVYCQDVPGLIAAWEKAHPEDSAPKARKSPRKARVSPPEACASCGYPLESAEDPSVRIRLCNSCVEDLPRTCKACGGDLSILGILGKITLLRCRNCGLDHGEE